VIRYWLHKLAGHRLTVPGAGGRAWFRDDDGTYFRNCPLIMAERKAELAQPWKPGQRARLDALQAEWWQAFRFGVTRRTCLSPGGIVVEPASFRVAYPGNPGLWVLDEIQP
jgi:hypothetical protein